MRTYFFKISALILIGLQLGCKAPEALTVSDIQPKSPSGGDSVSSLLSFSSHNDGAQYSLFTRYLAHGQGDTCLLNEAGKVLCWGDVFYGDGKLHQVDVPKSVQISASGFEFCALTKAGEVYCWGYRGYIFNSVNYENREPIKISLPEEARDLYQNESLACVVTASRKVMCWGDYVYGGLGPSFSPTFTPTYIDGFEDVEHFYLGRNSCAINSAGELFCVGQYFTDVTQIPAPEAVVDVATSSDHGCAVGQSGAIYCFGYDRGYSFARGDDNAIWSNVFELTPHLPPSP